MHGIAGSVTPLPQYAGAPAPSHVAAALRAAHTSSLVSASAWQAVGAPDMVLAQIDCFLAACAGPNSDDVTLDDIALAHSMQASVLLDTAGPRVAVEVLADALQHLAARMPYTHRGVALAVPAPLHTAACRLQHSIAIHSGKLRDAHALGASMAALAPCRQGVDAEQVLQLRLMQATTSLACGDHLSASTLAAEVTHRARSLGLGNTVVAALLVQSQAYGGAGDLLRAIPLAAEARDMAQALGSTAAQAEAVVALCELHLRRGLRAPSICAAACVKQALPYVLGHAPLSLRGRAHFALAKAYLADMSSCEELRAPGTIRVQDISAHCEAAAKEWTDAGDLSRAAEAVHLAAFVYHRAGETVRRDQAATRALSLAAAHQQHDGVPPGAQQGPMVRAFALGVADWPIALRLALGRGRLPGSA